MFSYTAYGLHVQSEQPLPELLKRDPARDDCAPADVIVRNAAVPRLLPDDAGQDMESTWTIEPGAASALIDVRGVGSYQINRGREILLDPAADSDPIAQRLFLLGPALAVLLHQRGLLILHASAAICRTRDGQEIAVAFVGEKGEGKSTMAAALHERGHGLIADDVVAVDLSTTPPTLRPGFPQIKLWPNSAAHFGQEPESMPRVHPQHDKRGRRVERGFPTTALPLRCVYVLCSGEREAIEPLRPQEMFIEMVRHSYMLPMLQEARESEPHFHHITRLTQTVAIRRLVRRRLLEALNDVAGLVEAEQGVSCQ